MKSAGCTAEYDRERADDLLRAYHSYIRGCRRVSTKAFYAVVEMPASRFWVSEERAAIVVGRMLQGDRLAGMLEMKREMFKEIFRRYKIMKEYYPDESVLRLTGRVVRQRAPRFYITAGRARAIILKHKARWHAERMRGLGRY